MVVHTSVIGESWRSFQHIKRLVIFGDSFSAVGYSSLSPQPTREDPLGVEFPGRAFVELDEPNWVGHLVTNYTPNPDLVAYDYAVGGSTVDGVKAQVEQEFLPYAGRSMSSAAWTAEDTLFVTWVGANDCRRGLYANTAIKNLFEVQEKLYQAGARNFLFVDVPPIHRAPGVSVFQVGPVRMRVDAWNIALRLESRAFSNAHPKLASVLHFSAWDSISDVLDRPLAHGIPERELKWAGGMVWIDLMHPSSRVHDVIARDFAQFLEGLPVRTSVP